MNRQGDVSPARISSPRRKGASARLALARHLLRQAYAGCRLTGKLSSHTRRNTYGQPVYEKSGRDLLKTQQAMGHKTPASTLAYLHIDERDIDALMLALEVRMV
jgi:integrase